MAITSRAVAMQEFAAGRGVFTFCRSPSGQNVTAAAAASGYFTAQLRANELTSTMPGTVDNWPTAGSLPSAMTLGSVASISTNGSGGQIHGILYRLGTLNLAATGDQFTHDAATFPVLRTRFGVANQPVPLIPLVQITTATATTAPVFRLRTAGGAAGYVDQDGNSVIGTKTMTMPAAATAQGSTFVFRLEDGDSAITDISAIEVTTAGTAGAATVWGLEIFTTPHTYQIYEIVCHDIMYGGLGLSDLAPAVATSGTATTLLGGVTLLAGTGSNGGIMWGVNL